MLDDETGVDHRFGDHRLRELAAGDLGGEPLRRALGHPQRERRRLEAEVGHDRGHEPAADRADGAERRVAGLETLEHREVGPEGVELAADVTRALEHEVSELGRHRAAAAPGEEDHPELLLELADLVGDVRLHRVQSIGGPGERPGVLDRQQGLEVTKIHNTPSDGSSAGGRTARLSVSDGPVAPCGLRVLGRGGRPGRPGGLPPVWQ